MTHRFASGEPATPSNNPPADLSTSPVGVAAVFTGFVLFSSGPPLVAGATLGGLSVGFWRAWIAAGVFALVALMTRTLRWRVVAVCAAPGVTFGLATGLFFEATQRTSVANAALIAALQPIPILVAARFLFRESVGRADVGWLVLAVSGSAFMIASADNSAGTSSTSGDVIAVFSMITSAAYFVTSRRARQTLDTIPFMAGMMLWAGVVITPMALLAGQDMVTGDGSEWVRLVAIALIPGLGHVLINYSHRTVPLVIIGLMQLLMPVGATSLAWWFLDQSVGTGQLVGMAVVVIALGAHTIHRARLSRAAVSSDQSNGQAGDRDHTGAISRGAR